MHDYSKLHLTGSRPPVRGVTRVSGVAGAGMELQEEVQPRRRTLPRRRQEDQQPQEDHRRRLRQKGERRTEQERAEAVVPHRGCSAATGALSATLSST